MALLKPFKDTDRVGYLNKFSGSTSTNNGRCGRATLRAFGVCLTQGRLGKRIQLISLIITEVYDIFSDTGSE